MKTIIIEQNKFRNNLRRANRVTPFFIVIFLLGCAGMNKVQSQNNVSCNMLMDIISKNQKIAKQLGIVGYIYEKIDSVIIVDMDTILSRDCATKMLNEYEVKYYWNRLPFNMASINSRTHKTVQGKGALVLYLEEVKNTVSSPLKKKYRIILLNHNAFAEIEIDKNSNYELTGLGVF